MLHNKLTASDSPRGFEIMARLSLVAHSRRLQAGTFGQLSRGTMCYNSFVREQESERQSPRVRDTDTQGQGS